MLKAIKQPYTAGNIQPMIWWGGPPVDVKFPQQLQPRTGAEKGVLLPILAAQFGLCSYGLAAAATLKTHMQK